MWVRLIDCLLSYVARIRVRGTKILYKLRYGYGYIYIYIYIYKFHKFYKIKTKISYDKLENSPLQHKISLNYLISHHKNKKLQYL